MRRIVPIIVSPVLNREWKRRAQRLWLIKGYHDKAHESWNIAQAYSDQGDGKMFAIYWDRGAKYKTYANSKQQIADLLWVDAVKNTWGEEMTITWKKRKTGYDCKLGNGAVYKHVPLQ